MNALAVVLVCGAAALWVRPPAPARAAVSPPGGSHRGWGRIRSRARRRGDGRDDAAIIGAALTSVAARLRAGQTPHVAWAEVINALPPQLASQMMLLDDGRAAMRTPIAAGSALYAAQAATRLAQDLGAELAPVLEACAEGIEESARAGGERDAAFAAPRATARLLLALPVAGVGLGAAMGAQPWILFTSSIWGGLLAVTAAALLLAGRWWIRGLLERARHAGQEGP